LGRRCRAGLISHPKDAPHPEFPATLGLHRATLARDAGDLTFTVLKDGEPVGQHRVALEREGDWVEIQEAADIEVRFAMIPIYRFEREGTEVWQNGRAVRVDGTTSDNGERFAITIRSHGDGYTRIINGSIDKFDESKQVLSFWDKDAINHNEFFWVIDDKILDFSFHFIGREKITVADRKLEADHYRMD
jgi:Family of unknown function (DUF6134)